MIVIIDYGVGNLASIKNMLKKVGKRSLISSSVTDIQQAEKLILPGVGAFDTCAGKLRDSHLLDTINEQVMVKKVPILGICVGMQLLAESSEEGQQKGLGWIKGKIVRFDATKLDEGNKIPHMGWTEVELVKPSRLMEGMHDEPRFYFVHSFHAQPENSNDVMLQAKYGYNFTAAVEHENILGVQFHPEKSHKFGMKLFENFTNNY